jgi:hypothetical protein
MNAPFHTPAIPAAKRQETAPRRKLWWTTFDWAAVDAGMFRAIADMKLKSGITGGRICEDRSAYDPWRCY